MEEIARRSPEAEHKGEIAIAELLDEAEHKGEIAIAELLDEMHDKYGIEQVTMRRYALPEQQTGANETV